MWINWELILFVTQGLSWAISQSSKIFLFRLKRKTTSKCSWELRETADLVIILYECVTMSDPFYIAQSLDPLLIKKIDWCSFKLMKWILAVLQFLLKLIHTVETICIHFYTNSGPHKTFNCFTLNLPAPHKSHFHIDICSITYFTQQFQLQYCKCLDEKSVKPIQYISFQLCTSLQCYTLDFDIEASNPGGLLGLGSLCI